MNFLGALGGSFFNQPLLVDARAADAFAFAVSHGLSGGGMAAGGAAARSGAAEDFILLDGGVALIEIEGFLVHHLGVVGPVGGVTGYIGIRKSFLAAYYDPRVRGILLSIDSLGGEVAGCFDLADMIFSARGKKPIWAILTENGCAGAYALASAADRVIVPRTGRAGGIGVVVLMAEISRALKNAGVKVNILTFGARKADGSEFAPLSGAARKRFQNDVNKVGQIFVAAVARHRRMEASKILAMDGGSFMGAAALRRGLVDAVQSPQAAFAGLLKKLKA